MSKILVAGLINVETTLKVDGFPLEYSPVSYPFFGINTTASGVGYNVAKALHTLGDDVKLLSLIGQDAPALVIRDALTQAGINAEFVLPELAQTPQSVILYDPAGRRAINTDLKNIQETIYPPAEFETALPWCDLAVICNINFARPFLQKAREAGKPVATDVHAIGQLDDTYNADFMAAANILFMSHERLPCEPEEWSRKVLEQYGPEIVVIGLGAEGVLLAVRQDNFVGRFPAVTTRPVVSTIGAGDALFSAFVHFYAHDRDPYTALRRAITFASWKIGVTGGADGFMTEAELLQLLR